MGWRSFLFTLLLIASLAAWADDTAASHSDIQAGLRHRYPNCKLGTVQLRDMWAVAMSQDPSGPRQHLMHRFENRWEVIVSAPAIPAATLSVYGVPKKSWQPLLGRPLSPKELAEATQCADQRAWAWTSQREVTEDDCAGRSVWELLLMRNEILAFHGRPFVDPELARYFRSRGWYKPNPGYDAATLNQIETDNAEFILYYLLSQRHF
ncbi:MAG: YARHG domain-containing protein [Vulcanimicrobiota bacterium]